MDKIKEVQWRDVKTSMPPKDVTSTEGYSVIVFVTDGIHLATAHIKYLPDGTIAHGWTFFMIQFEYQLGFIPTHWSYQNFLP